MAGEGHRSSARAVPPAEPHGTVIRPRLDDLLAEGTRRRLITVVADAGFGKSTLLASWAARNPCAWYTVTAEDRTLAAMVNGLLDALRLRVPALSSAIAGVVDGPRGPDADAEQPMRALAYAAALAEAMERHLTDDLVLVLDDVQELSPEDPAATLIEGLIRAGPPVLHLVLASRCRVPFRIERLRGRGQVLEIDAATLAFTAEETEEALRAVLGEAVPKLAVMVHEAVRGWPAAARLAGEALRPVPPADREARLRRALRPGGPVFGYLAEEIFANESERVRHLISTVACLPWFSADLCAEIGITDADDLIDSLDTRGFLVAGGDADRYQLNPLIREFALTRMPLDPADRHAAVLDAGRFFAGTGDYREALSCLRTAGDSTSVSDLLWAHGHAMIAGGDAEAVVEAIAATAPAPRDGVLDQLDGEARQVLGDWVGAQASFERIIGDEGPVAVGLAWRMGLIHHLRGHLDDAIATYRRGTIDGSEPKEEALLQAWWASAHWLRGEIDECRQLSAAALSAAHAAYDDRALAAAHTVLAMLAALDSDPRANAAHYLRALDHAERAGDVLQSIRIRVNRSSHHIAEAQYAQGISELDVAIRLADLAGFAAFRALALNNRGEALLGLGRLDEARAELEASRLLYQRLESKLVAHPLTNLGEVYRQRGDLAMARACYEEAISMAGDTRDMQSLVPSLAGLARVLIEEQPDRATELVELARRAVSYGPVLGQSAALLSLGWVSLHRGHSAEAAAAADEAAALSRRRRDRAGLAEALELKAAATSSVRPVDQYLQESLNIRREIGDPLGQARVELMLARRATGERARELAASAHQKFLAAGATRYAARAALAEERAAPPDVRVECLGGFRVVRDGNPVPLGEWPSRKARDLLKILIARRGHRVPRAQLMDSLWPGEAESVVSARLSVALSTVRSVLDPGKRFAPDHFVGADRASVWLDLAMTSIDVEEFLRDAQAGLDAAKTGHPAQAVLLLRTAEAAYTGDFLDEDVYQDWAGALREEARSVYVRVAHYLADHAVETGENYSAAAYSLRILQHDQYDERAHLALVRSSVMAGAHGEARRAYRTYVARMSELGVEPAQFPNPRGAERNFKAV
ncbi:BTAD domain-containing putative transcriptional regulator [Actinokineospora xionganensis]|uniref:Tetratricopeptide repeat protein n=1 Tax=Actinokineospora xionganensis TaxID=2684470 RepID=A0ABR7LGJ1_9PSEU|nr:BTAD domain-containing putative transcriptional regulator [Actinokineospora xionganensis]MBC6451677.1 tetratricopeptide repeat protein [Actinokineospora xionganensis]